MKPNFRIAIDICLMLIIAVSFISNMQARETNTTEAIEYASQHKHMLMVHASYLDLLKKNVQNYYPEISNQGFLEKIATKSDNPIAPCAMLSNKIIALVLAHFVPSKYTDDNLPAPLKGSNIFGMYDDLFADNGLFEQQPTIQAEMLARLHIYWSGGYNQQVNRFIKKLNQKQCLNYLLHIDHDRLIDVTYEDSPQTHLTRKHSHYAAVEMQVSTYTKQDINKYLNELRDPASLTLSSDETDNPVMPCSLLRSHGMANGVRGLWNGHRDGTLAPVNEDTPFLYEYRNLIKDGRIPSLDLTTTTKITAGYFINYVFFTDIDLGKRMNGLSQRECLNLLLERR